MISLTFHGAARSVTGSKYLLQVNNRRILVDCGLFQGRREIRQRNWEPLDFDASDIEAVIVTHAHLDHIGFVPCLVRNGFNSVIYSTPPTADMADVLLKDAGHIQEEDAEYRNRKKITRHAPALPLFTVEDAKKALTFFKPAPFGQWIELGKEIKFRYHVAGHILGAASVEIVLDDGDRKKTILFSGDVGRFGVPLIVDPAEPPEVDYLVCESTYGNRFHPPNDLFFAMANLINEAIERKSVLLMPAFAIGRTQQLTYMINVLIQQGEIPPIQVNIDSPMAVKATEIYCKYPGYHSVNTDALDDDPYVLCDKNVVLHRKRKSSKLLNKVKGPAIIISASGMLTGGRIMHHLMQRLPDPNTTLALVGFMAEGTLGRKISDGEKLVYIHKQPVEVNARVVHQSGLSAHADYLELMHWLEPFKTKPDKVYVTHGELDSSQAMLERLTDERGWNCMVPELDQTVEL